MAAISVQVSLYPLRQEHISLPIDEAVAEFHHHGLEVNPGTMSTVVLGEEEPVFSALREAFHKASQQGEVAMVVTLSNACPRAAGRSSPK